MTKRLSEHEKAKRAFYRRDAARPHPRLVERTPKEKAAFLAMLEEQGRQTAARGQRLLQQIELDDARRAAEGCYFDPNGVTPARMFVPGGTVMERIAARTDAFYGGMPLNIMPWPWSRGRRHHPPPPRPPWWAFWRSR